MFAIFPLIISFIFLFSIFKKITSDWRKSFLVSSIAWGFLLTAITELLSILNSLAFKWIEISWVFISFLSLIVYFLLERRKSNEFPKISIFLGSLLAGVFFIFIMIGLIALTAPPNTWDSMTYHMSRVVHWIQNGNVSFYPTHILRQLCQPPWAEYAIAHFQILSGGDRFANIIQWFSMVGSTLGISLIAKQLGANLRGQVFAMVLCSTIPMGILQGSSTQNDYVVSFWLVCFVYFLILFKSTPKLTTSLGIGASLGLAILTKGTAYIYASPFLIWYFFSGSKDLRWNFWKPLAITVILVILINSGHYWRNLSLFGSPIDSGHETYNNEAFTMATFISNVSRNVGLHIGMPSPINIVMENGIQKLHNLMKVDINDPRTTWPGTEFHVRGLSMHEDTAGNPVHLFLIVMSAALFLISKNQRNSQNLAGYFIAVTAAFLLFSFYLKWQPWHNRLHLPVFVLFSPFIAIVLSNIAKHKIANIIIVSLILLSFAWVFFNKSRPLLGNNNIFSADRISLYFYNNFGLKDPYIYATNFLMSKGCSNIGLVLGGDDWEYPFWVLLRGNDKNIRIEHVNVQNESAVKSSQHLFATFAPCAIISSNQGQEGLFVRLLK